MATILEFDYTAVNGKQTHRTVLELSSPTKLHLTVDIEELDDESQLALAQGINIIKEQYNNALVQLLENYDIKHNLRNFDSTRMENVIAETY
jgi:hypothetical protein